MEFKIFERRECPICQDRKGKVLFSTYDDRYGQPDLYSVMECQECRTCYLLEAIAPNDLPNLYEKYYGGNLALNAVTEKVMTQHFYTNPAVRVFTNRLRRSIIGVVYQSWFRFWSGDKVLDWTFRQNEQVLDVGCGGGHLAEPILACGAKWTGLDIDPRNCQAVTERGLKCICGTIDAVDLPAGSYDSIIGSQVIEHISDPRKFLMRCAQLIRPGGRVLLSTPNIESRYRRISGQNWIHWFVPYHQVLFSPHSLEMLGKQCNLRMLSYRTETPTAWALLQLNYQRPPRGEIGTWRSKGRPRWLQPDGLSLRLRLEDTLYGDGDVLIAELVKA
ncbi:MAG: methyltransferase domain-containing protein [Nitrospirae bacterium]|nr:methyltransferase domain-containing protein [Nitrospirota bacterium]